MFIVAQEIINVILKQFEIPNIIKELLIFALVQSFEKPDVPNSSLVDFLHPIKNSNFCTYLNFYLLVFILTTWFLKKKNTLNIH